MKLKLSSVQQYNTFDLSKVHATTTEFGQLNVADSIEVLPGDKINIDFSQFSRTAALALPTFGKIKINTFGVFVPYHIVDQTSDSFLAGEKYFQGAPVVQPRISDGVLRNVFGFSASTNIGNFPLVSTTSSDGPKFAKIQVNGSTNISQTYLTPKGRFVYRILRQLGYDITDTSTSPIGQYFNAYPLLSFFKAYNDLLSNQQTQSSSLFSSILNAIYKHDSNTSFTYPTTAVSSSAISSDGIINYHAIIYLFSQVKILWNDDIITSAWSQPNSPTSSLNNVQNTIRTPSLNRSLYTGEGTNAPILTSTSTETTYPTVSTSTGSDVVISQQSLNYLRKFDQFVRRSNYVGSLATTNLLARYGINIGDVKHLYAQPIGFYSDDMLIGDVTSQAGTDTQPLASYAGKAVGSSDCHFNFESTDFGQLIIFVWYSPVICYGAGIDHSVLRNNFLEFYQPEFDGEISDPISVKEVYSFKSDSHGDVSDAGLLLSTDVFGFTERYTNGYRTRRDIVTGDMVNWNQNYNWALHRMFHLSDLISPSTLFPVAQSDSILYQPIDNHPCNTIFQSMGSYGDHFYLYFTSKVHASRKMLSTSASTGLPEGDITINKNGQTYR